MFRSLATFSIPVVLFNAVPASAVQSSETSRQETKKKAGPAATSMTGCIDESEGHYILVDDRALKPVASLEAEGFPPEGFAKYLGHRVTVWGNARTRDPAPVFKVRRIETLSETCAPEQ